MPVRVKVTAPAPVTDPVALPPERVRVMTFAPVVPELVTEALKLPGVAPKPVSLATARPPSVMEVTAS